MAIDYKSLIKSRETRLRLLKLLDFLPDKTVVRLQYRIKTGRRLNLNSPTRFSEKLQWYKLYYRDMLMSMCADKYSEAAKVIENSQRDINIAFMNELSIIFNKEYVTECGYEGILNPIIGIYNSVDEIDFEKLPNQFVIKDTLGWGGTSVIIVTDKGN